MSARRRGRPAHTVELPRMCARIEDPRAGIGVRFGWPARVAGHGTSPPSGVLAEPGPGGCRLPGADRPRLPGAD
ncbi:hypothetical protein ACQEVC_05350 [Plantactinospora sp. CA-294935]|uniref:hypothetical protein n=1 Tax=Plantactinospora sp. CA-294935 TaxID=3240012 RepID=UPI003D92FF30